MKDIKIVLASGSLRRKQLLKEVCTDFISETADVEELHDSSIPAAELCEHNALLKAREVATRHPDKLIIGSDTLVFFKGQPLGKPMSVLEARNTLEKLSGQFHQVCTGVAFVYNDEELNFHEVTQVEFKVISAETIKEYLGKVDVMDKAGSYAIQEHGDMLIKAIKGDYNNVVGMPLELLRMKLSAFLAEITN